MRSLHSFLPVVLCVSLFACSSPARVKVAGNTMPDPSPVSYPDQHRGATVIVTFIFKFKDKKTGEESMQQLTITGIAVAEKYILTSAAPLSSFGSPEKIIVSVPDYVARRNTFSAESKIVATSNSGLLLIETPKAMPATVTISSKDGPFVTQAVSTVDVLNGSIPGVSHSGHVSYVVIDDHQFGLLLIDVSSSPSSMGCGVYGADGYLVAMVLGPSQNGQLINYSTVMAISAKDVRNFLDAQNVKYATAKASTK